MITSGYETHWVFVGYDEKGNHYMFPPNKTVTLTLIEELNNYTEQKFDLDSYLERFFEKGINDCIQDGFNLVRAQIRKVEMDFHDIITNGKKTEPEFVYIGDEKCIKGVPIETSMTIEDMKNILFQLPYDIEMDIQVK